MREIQAEAQDAVNKLLEDQKAVEGSCSLALYEFDSFVRRLYSGALEYAPEYVLKPKGMTVLLDAIGKAIIETGEYLAALAPGDRPEKITFVVMTDGDENASTQYSHGAVTEMIKHQTDKYDWEFVFLGAGIKVAKQGLDLGFSPFNTVVFAANSGVSTANAYAGFSDAMARSRSGENVTYAASYDADGNITADSY